MPEPEDGRRTVPDLPRRHRGRRHLLPACAGLEFAPTRHTSKTAPDWVGREDPVGAALPPAYQFQPARTSANTKMTTTTTTAAISQRDSVIGRTISRSG